MSDAFISVILPAYNAELYIEAAVESVLLQSHRNFELIIANDGSKDGTLEILHRLQKKDSRIRVIDQENKGLITTLNMLLSECKGEFIARMDADDICHVDRFKAQVEYLKKHPEVSVVGSGYRYIDEHGNVLGTRHIRSGQESVTASLVFGCPLAHPTVMINRSVCNGALQYDANFPHAEDMAMWANLVFGHNLVIDNIATELLDYRVHSNSVSSVYQTEQLASAHRCLRQYPFVKAFESHGGNIEKTYNYQGYLALGTVWALYKANKSCRVVSSAALVKRAVLAILSNAKRSLLGSAVAR